MKTLLAILAFCSISFAQMRPLPAVFQVASYTSDLEPDIHNKVVNDIATIPVNKDFELLSKINDLQDIRTMYSVENSRLRTELEIVKERRNLEKKIAGFTGLLLFASGNESLKNIGLVGLFCYSIW